MTKLRAFLFAALIFAVRGSGASASPASANGDPVLHLRILGSNVVPNVQDVGLRKQGGVYRIYVKGRLGHQTECVASVDKATAEDLLSTWRLAMSGDARWASENGIDGETYEFTTAGPPTPISRSIWSPEPETFPGRLVDLSMAMTRFCAMPTAQPLAALRAKSAALRRDLMEADGHRGGR
jgi:hypothetical protein